jgi:membrane associated rhomboid family serine protease
LLKILLTGGNMTLMKKVIKRNLKPLICLVGGMALLGLLSVAIDHGNIWLGAVGGAICGLIVAVMYVLVWTEKEKQKKS